MTANCTRRACLCLKSVRIFSKTFTFLVEEGEAEEDKSHGNYLGGFDGADLPGVGAEELEKEADEAVANEVFGGWLAGMCFDDEEENEVQDRLDPPEGDLLVEEVS